MYNAPSYDRNATPLIIDRHLSWEIVRPFCTGLGLLILIFIGFSSARQLSFAAQGQLDISTAFQLIGLNTLITLEILLPSAFFFSVLAAVGRLYRDSEMTAYYAAGVSRARILEAVLKLALVIALITGFISVLGRPWAYRTSYALEAAAEAKFDLKQMAAGQFVNLGGSDYTFIAKDIDLARGLHKNVFLQKDHPKAHRTEIIVAESASLPTLNPGEAMQAQFYNGYNYLLDRHRRQDMSLKFKELVIRLPNEEAREHYRRKAETTLNLAASSEPRDIAEYQWRITTPLATVLLGLIAVPLARSAARESRTRNFFIALLVYITLFSMISVTRTWIEQEKLQALPGLWSVYAIQAVVLLLLVTQPWLKRR
ncbi:MAG: LPS export ABC transporter permease LptF [Gammaproteobacteria bacterium]|nr:MAG: LPS export ABC transporter permease LptF [Gammaproteobacteria bacterium]